MLATRVVKAQQKTKSLNLFSEHQLSGDHYVTIPPGPFELDDSSINRPRVVREGSKRGETERLQFRCDTYYIRRMEELLAARIDPEVKTKSDILQDAVALWFEHWDRRYPDGAGGSLSLLGQSIATQRKIIYRNTVIEHFRETLDIAREARDRGLIEEHLSTMVKAKGTFLDDAPDVYIAQLDSLISDARRLLNS